MAFPALQIDDLVAKIPIIQGGMGVGISLSGLASAVANEGGIGVIASAMIGIQEPDIFTDPQGANIRALTREIRKAKERTTGILGVNIMVALTDFSELVKAAVKEKIDIIFAGAGLPLDLPKYVLDQRESEGNNAMHTKLAPIISSARAATLLCKKWLAKFDYLPDAFVVEGPLAGGHLGFKPEQINDPNFALEKIVPEVLEAVKPFEQQKQRPIPIIAAGGIYTGEDICNFLRKGATGVQMGTRFVATHECDADVTFKNAYIEAEEDDVTIITSPVGLPGRAIRNQFLEDVTQGKKVVFKCPYHCITSCNYQTAPYCIAAALNNAQKGRLQSGFAFVGQNVDRVTEIVSVKELMASLTEPLHECL